MEATVDIRDQEGKSLSDIPRTTPVAATTVFDDQMRDADAYVAKIIGANLGRRQIAAAPTATQLH